MGIDSPARRAPHHVIYLILQTPPSSEWRLSQLYGDAQSREKCKICINL